MRTDVRSPRRIGALALVVNPFNVEETAQLITLDTRKSYER
jgi:hypothetical protein